MASLRQIVSCGKDGIGKSTASRNTFAAPAKLAAASA